MLKFSVLIVKEERAGKPAIDISRLCRLNTSNQMLLIDFPPL